MKKIIYYPFISFLLFFSMGMSKVQGQTLEFTTSFPNLDKSEIIVSDDTARVGVSFSVKSGNLLSPVVKISLPDGLQYCEMESVATPIPVESVTANATGDTITIKYTGALLNRKEIALNVKVIAACGAKSGSIGVAVYSGADVIPLLNESVLLTVSNNIIISNAPNPNLVYRPNNMSFNVNLSTDKGHVDSLQVKMLVPYNTYLSDFELDGFPLSKVTKVESGEDTLYTITITTADMGGRLDTTIKTLSFAADIFPDILICTTPSIAFHTVNACGDTSQPLYLSILYPISENTPKITRIKVVYINRNGVEQNSSTSATAVNLHYDMTTPNIVKHVYKNTGTDTAYNLYFQVYRYTYNLLIDTSDVWYYINSNAAKKIPSSLFVIPNNSTYRLSNSSTYGYIKDEYYRKPTGFQLTMSDVTLAPGDSITFLVPQWMGDIHKDTTLAVGALGTRYYQGICSYMSATNRCGVIGSYDINTHFMRNTSPVLHTNIDNLPILASGETTTASVPFRAGNLLATSGGNAVRIDIQLPPWLTLDGPKEDAIKFVRLDGLIPGTTIDSVSLNPNGTYSVYTSYLVNTDYTMDVKYKAAACNDTNYNHLIHYRIYLKIGKDSSLTNYPWMNLGHQYQNVSLLCEEKGISFYDFHLQRLSKGLTDHNDDGIPDDGTLAPDSVINHNVYMGSPIIDTGRLIWRGAIVSDSCRYLYATLSSNDLTMHTSANRNMQLDTNGVVIQIKRNGTVASYPIRYVPNAATYKSFYLLYKASTTPLLKGDSIEIVLPFRAYTVKDFMQYNISAELFVSDSLPIATPLNSSADTNRLGEVIRIQKIAILNPYYYSNKANSIFLNNDIKDNYIGYSIIFYGGGSDLLNGYYAKEVRRHMYLSRFKTAFPPGYIVDDTLRLCVYLQRDTISRPLGEGSTYHKITPSAYDPIDNSYEYDIAAIMDLLYDGTPGTSFDPTKKLMLPDDYWYYQFYFKMQATRSAPARAYITDTCWYKIPGRETEYARASGDNYLYDGLRTSLDYNPKQVIPANEKVLNVPQVSFHNYSSKDIHNNWLYVSGNVENIYLSATESNTPILASGTGYQGRWIKLADILSATSSIDYQLNFTYTGGSDCAGDTILLYAISTGDDATGLVDTANAVNPLDGNRLSGQQTVFIKATSAQVGGKFTLSTDTLIYDRPYKLTAELNSRASAGPLNNPSMVITIPPGQMCDTTQISFEYPIGTVMLYSAFPDSVKQRIRPLSIESDFPRTFVFRLNDFVSQAFMAGYSGTPDPLEQETRLHLGFIPKCATNLSGLQFGGLLYGESTCGLAASGSGLLVYSPKMYAYGLSKYLVDINVSLLSGNRAFNELLTLDTVEIAIIKLDDNPMNNTDSLSIEFPEEININGALAVKGSGALAGIPTSATVGSNTINLGRRSVNLSVAASDVNSTANNGKNDTITYLIPILYTASAFVAPTHSIDASLNSPVKFADHCPSQPASVGSGKEEIAILTGVENPKAICYNGTDSITINTIGFNGGFYLDKDLTQLYQAAGKSSILHTPSAVGDTTFYVDAMINGTSYGYVPVRFSVRQPATASVNTTTFTILDTADAIIVPVTVHADTSSKIRYIHTYNMTPLLADTLHFDVPQGVANFNWNLDYDKTRGIHYYRLLDIVDGHGCPALLDLTDSIIVKVVNCHPDSSFTIGFTSIIVNDLPYGQCDTLPVVLPATLTYHWLTQYGLDPEVTISTPSSLTDPFLPGVTRIIWTATDICSKVVIDTQFVVVNLSPCDGKDTLWNIDGTFNMINLSIKAKDAENTEYETVRIGCDCWTRENLVSRNYDPVSGGGTITDDLVYSSAAYPDRATNLTTFGRLYTWKDATKNGTSQGICPNGWVLPSVAHYMTLLTYGAYAISASGGDYWLGAPATNTTNFSALPAGYYQGSISAYYQLLGDAYFWTSEIGTTTIGKACHLHYGCPDIVITDFNKLNGGSVRCVKSN